MLLGRNDFEFNLYGKQQESPDKEKESSGEKKEPSDLGETWCELELTYTPNSQAEEEWTNNNALRNIEIQVVVDGQDGRRQAKAFRYNSWRANEIKKIGRFDGGLVHDWDSIKVTGFGAIGDKNCVVDFSSEFFVGINAHDFESEIEEKEEPK